MKSKLLIITLMFFISISFQSSQAQQTTSGWYWMNGKPQTNTLNWVKMFDGSNIYAVGEMGTFMKSSDGGDSWLISNNAGIEELEFGSGSNYRIYSAWFFDANTGFLACQSLSGDGGKLRYTNNAGETFSTIDLNAGTGGISVKDIMFINPTTGFICGSNNVKAMKTTNGGFNWTTLPNLPVDNFYYNCLYAIDENHIFLGTSSDRKIVRTTNGGDTWSIDILPGTVSVSIQDIEFQDANTGFIGGANTYFASTTNGGVNWTQSVFPNNQMAQNCIKIVGSTVYSLGSYQHVYYTSNLGATWDSLDFYDPSNINQENPFIMYSMDINGDNMIVVGLRGLMNISNDGGATWRNKNYSVGYNYMEYIGVYALSGSGDIWACGSAKGIMKSTNGGTNWALQSLNLTGTQLRDIYFVNSNVGYCVGGNMVWGESAALKTTNGGSTWSNMTLPTHHQNQEVDFVNENTGWIWGGIGGFVGQITIVKTTNGGSTWISQPNNINYSNIISSGDMADANTGYCVSGEFLFKTTNGGAMWNSVSMPFGSARYRKVKTLSPTNVILISNGDDRMIYKTIDGGISWETVPNPNPINQPFSMDWTDQYNGIVTGSQGYTAKTSDGGLTWKERNPGSSTIPAVHMTSKDTVFAGCDRNVESAAFRLYDDIPTISLNLTTGIEGFWNGTKQVKDTIRCYLRSSVSPYAKIDSAIAYAGSWGYASYIFQNAPSGSYYIHVSQRNTIETWSANPVSFVRGGVTENYNLTTAEDKAYGNNMTLVSGRYCIYSGDVDKNGDVNLTDLVETYNASSNFTTGYVVQDVNGDSIVDLSDITIIYNNSRAFVSKVTP